LRPFNEPQPVEVETGEAKTPVAVFLSGYRCAVESVLDAWRIDDEWWRERPVSRTYWRLLLENGCAIDVYRDEVSGRWYKQAYMG
jgi:protein ImuB